MPYLLRNVDTGAYFAGYSDNAAGYTRDEAAAHRFDTVYFAERLKCGNEIVVYRPHGSVHD
jgi:hypothetical protein